MMNSIYKSSLVTRFGFLVLLLINNIDLSYQQFWRDDKAFKEWELLYNNRLLAGIKAEPQPLTALTRPSSSTTNKAPISKEVDKQPQPKVLEMPQQIGRSQFALTYDFMNQLDNANYQASESRIGEFLPNIPIYPSVQVMPPQVPLPPIPQSYQPQPNFPQPIISPFQAGPAPIHPLPPAYPPSSPVFPPPPPPPPAPVAPVLPPIVNKPIGTPFVIQQQGISNTGEAIIENLVGGIPFDCRGRPTGHFRDMRFCDIFHACVFGTQRKTYACPIVGERTYFDEITRRCEFISRPGAACTNGAYYV